MEIDINESGLLVACKIYNPLILETAEGAQFSVTTRDEGIEILLGSPDAPRRVVAYLKADGTVWRTETRTIPVESLDSNA